MLLQHTRRDILSDEELDDLTQGLPGGWTWEYVDGRIIMSPPADPNTGNLNAKIIARVVAWGERHGYEPFDSDTGFRMANGDLRAPDAALIVQERWNAEAPDRRKYLVPDIAIELRSGSDRRATPIEKCLYWQSAGAGYVLLVDPYAPDMSAFGVGSEHIDRLYADVAELIAVAPDVAP